MYDREDGCIAGQECGEDQTKYCPSRIGENKQFDQMHWPVLSTGERERISAVSQVNECVANDEPLRQAVKRGNPTAQDQQQNARQDRPDAINPKYVFQETLHRIDG